MTAGSILVVDDDETITRGLGRVLRDGGYEVDIASGGAEAVRKLEARPYGALLVDLAMPEIDGFAVMKHALHHRRVSAVVVVTGTGTIPVAVEAMRAGANDFLTKPVAPETVRAAVARALGGAPAAERDAELSAWRARYAPELVGEHANLREMLGVISRVADTDCNVLITGKSGTGKELVARAIHAASPRAHKPLVAINCAAIPRDLMESEIFGHAKGAYTGATEKREGKFQVADGGTLFLDEVSEMDVTLQGKFLRLIQEKEYTPVGESHPRKADVRIVAATNQDLEQRCHEGRFREDLYYRLNVIPVPVPSLAARAGDIPHLAAHFVRWANNRHHRSVEGFTDETMRMLTGYAWPGNVREMQNLIERLVILTSRGRITAADLPANVRREQRSAAQPELAPEGLDLNAALERLERRMTLDALRRSNGNKAKAAELLGLKRTTLVERLKKLGITENAFEE